MERKFLDFSLPGSECSTERKFHRNESSLYGLFAPGNESAEERKGQLPPVVEPGLYTAKSRLDSGGSPALSFSGKRS